MTQSECWKAINNGKKLINRNTRAIIWLSEDGYARENGTGNKWNLESPSRWRIYEEPVLYYRWKRLSEDELVYYSVGLYPEGKRPIGPKWVRIEPGKNFEDIT